MGYIGRPCHKTTIRRKEGEKLILESLVQYDSPEFGTTVPGIQGRPTKLWLNEWMNPLVPMPTLFTPNLLNNKSTLLSLFCWSQLLALKGFPCTCYLWPQNTWVTLDTGSERTWSPMTWQLSHCIVLVCSLVCLPGYSSIFSKLCFTCHCNHRYSTELDIKRSICV